MKLLEIKCVSLTSHVRKLQLLVQLLVQLLLRVDFLDISKLNDEQTMGS